MTILSPGELTEPSTDVRIGLVDAVTEATARFNEAVEDQDGFFRTSQLVDSLRDVTSVLHRRQRESLVAAETREAIVAEYERLRTTLQAVLAEPFASESGAETLSLSPEDPLDLIVFASAQLARYIDALQFLPGHRANQAITQASIKEMSSKLGLFDNKTADVRPGGPGQYL